MNIGRLTLGAEVMSLYHAAYTTRNGSGWWIQFRPQKGIRHTFFVTKRWN